MLKEVIKVDKKALKFYALLGELQNISTVIQTQRFNFNNLKELKNHSVVKNAVSNLKNTFKDDLNKGNEF